MSLKIDKPNMSIANRLFELLLAPSSIELVADIWKVTKKLWRGLSNEGMYEVLEYRAICEIKDKYGKAANFKKQQKVRYLQDNIISYQDQVWGEGENLLNYQSAPGVKADEYRLGQKTFILISLREMKQKGEVDEFNIEWDMKDSFLKPNEYWETEISHRTKKVVVDVIFPKNRLPQRATVTESTRRRTQVLGPESFKNLPDGRLRVRWESSKPRLYERYILKWDW